ncbi:metallophosphoesterase family protein [Candidatus Poribacteria bacterium]
MSSIINSGNLKFVAYITITILSVLSLSALLSCAEVDEIGDVKWSFVVCSDNRGSNPAHRAALTSIAKIKPDVILNLGDIVFRLEDYGTVASFRKDVEECYGNFDSFLKIFYPSIGGHDERYYNQSKYPPDGREPDNEAGRKFYDEVKLQERITEFNDECGDYYFSHKGVHFIMLYRSDEWEFQDGQVSWLKSILEKINGDGPVIVTGHAGMWFYPISGNQKEIVKLLREHNVDIALAADFHDYYVEEYSNMLMFRSGSLGYGDAIFIRFDVTDKGFIIKAFEPDGITLFTKRKDVDGNVMHPHWVKKFGEPGQKMP